MSPRLFALVAALLTTAASIVLSTACQSQSYRVMPVRAGALYTSKGDRCGIRFENLNFQEASSKYENLGLISVTGTSSDEFTGAMKSDVERAACHMGADAVSLNVATQGVFQFMVWRGR